MLVLEYKVKASLGQYKAIDEAIRTVQFIRNKCLRYWMDAPKDAKINCFALNKYSTELRNEFKFVKDLNSMAVQASAERSWLAIARFYDNCKSKRPGKKGFPRFQKDNRSVEYKTSGWKLHPESRRITITDKKGIGELKLLGKWDIHTYPVKSIKRVRLVRRADGYYCQFAVDVDCLDVQPKTGKEIGLDVGLESFYTDSNGRHEPNPKFLKTADKDIKHAQRQIYKKKKGSNNRRRARVRYSKKHLRVRCDSLRVNHGIKSVHNLSWQTVTIQDDRTLGLIRVQAPSTRLRYDSLPAHTAQTRFLESEAGNRTQSDIRCGVTLALTGSSYGENRALKSDPSRSGAQHKTPDFTGASFPPHVLPIAARVKGIQWLKWLHLKERTI